MAAPDVLDDLLRHRGGLNGLARQAGQGDPAIRQGSVPNIKPRPMLPPIRPLLQRDAVEVLFAVIAATLLACFACTLL